MTNLEHVINGIATYLVGLSEQEEQAQWQSRKHNASSLDAQTHESGGESVSPVTRRHDGGSKAAKKRTNRSSARNSGYAPVVVVPVTNLR